MTITPNWQNCSDNAHNNTGTSVGVGSTNPVGANGSIASGDLLIASIVGSNGATDIGSCAASMVALGWTTIYDAYNANDTNRVWVGVKIAGPSESGAYTATWASSATIGVSWSLADFGGVDQTTPVEASAGVTTSYDGGLYPAPSIVTTTVGDMLVCLWLTGGGGGPYSVDATMTQFTQIQSTSSTRPNIMLAYEQLVAAGATGVKNGSTTGNTPSTGVSMALKPASGGGGAPPPWFPMSGDSGLSFETKSVMI